MISDFHAGRKTMETILVTKVSGNIFYKMESIPANRRNTFFRGYQ